MPYRDPWQGGFVRWPRSMREHMISVRPGIDKSILKLADPEVQDTDKEYRLTFTLPEGVQPDDFNVAITGGLVTVKVEVTREKSDASTGRRGWASRSSRTDSVSRSFVLPEGIASSDAIMSRTEEGKVEVTFGKRLGDNNNNVSGMEGKGAGGNDIATAGVDKGIASSASASYLSSLSGGDTVERSKGDEAETDASVSATQQASPSSRTGERRQPRSMFDAMLEEFDEDFGDLSKLMWGDEAFRFPTQEEMAARAEAAREGRARRVKSIRRSRMATDVTEEDGSYVVR